MVKPRPGGRTAQTRAAVFAAVETLLAEKDPHALSLTEIAERAGVAATSLYRRWGDVRTLLMEVAVDQLTREAPLPDTGSLKGDLSAWAASIAGALSSREGSAFFRVFVATAPGSGEDGSARLAAVMRRGQQIQALLERARARGETAPAMMEVTDHLLAPLYVRALLGAPADPAAAQGFVDRLLAQSAANH